MWLYNEKGLVLLTSLLLSVVVFSQTTIGKVSAIIIDESQKPWQSALVSLLHAKDSTLVKIVATNNECKYEFENISEGKLFVSISSIGPQKICPIAGITAANSACNADVISLAAQTKSIQALTATAKKPVIETEIDKAVANVDASPTNARFITISIEAIKAAMSNPV